MGKTYFVGLSGETNYQAAIGPHCVKQPVTFLHEPDNPFDPRAIRVANYLGQTMGYLPRNGWLSRVLLDDELAVNANVKSADLVPDTGIRAVVIEVLLGEWAGGPPATSAYRSAEESRPHNSLAADNLPASNSIAGGRYRAWAIGSLLILLLLLWVMAGS